jgi:hypothetical protein
MFCVCCHISASLISSLKVRDEMLQSWDSPRLLIFFQPLHNHMMIVMSDTCAINALWEHN